MDADEKYRRLESLVKELLYTSGSFSEMPGSHYNARRMIDARDAIVALIGVKGPNVLVIEQDAGTDIDAPDYRNPYVR